MAEHFSGPRLSPGPNLDLRPAVPERAVCGHGVCVHHPQLATGADHIRVPVLAE